MAQLRPFGVDIDQRRLKGGETDYQCNSFVQGKRDLLITVAEAAGLSVTLSAAATVVRRTTR